MKSVFLSDFLADVVSVCDLVFLKKIEVLCSELELELLSSPEEFPSGDDPPIEFEVTSILLSGSGL